MAQVNAIFITMMNLEYNVQAYNVQVSLVEVGCCHGRILGLFLIVSMPESISIYTDFKLSGLITRQLTNQIFGQVNTPHDLEKHVLK